MTMQAELKKRFLEATDTWFNRYGAVTTAWPNWLQSSGSCVTQCTF
jgi:hypothetical protein